MMTRLEFGGVVYPFAPSPGPGAESEGGTRPLIDEGRTAPPSVRVDPPLTASDFLPARGREAYPAHCRSEL